MGEETFYRDGEALDLDLLAGNEGGLLGLLLLEIYHLGLLLGLVLLLGLLLLEDISLVHHLSSVVVPSSQDFSKGDEQRKVFGSCQTLIWKWPGVPSPTRGQHTLWIRRILVHDCFRLHRRGSVEH